MAPGGRGACLGRGGPAPLQPPLGGTWKELRKRSKNSLAKRRVPWACSSVTKANTTSWTPSRGMRVSVDLASLWGRSLSTGSGRVPPRPPRPPARPHPPELVVRVAHLMGPQLGHEDVKDPDEDEEVDLHAEVAAQGCPGASAPPPPRPPGQGARWLPPGPRDPAALPAEPPSPHQKGQEDGEAQDPPEAHVSVTGPAPTGHGSQRQPTARPPLPAGPPAAPGGPHPGHRAGSPLPSAPQNWPPPPQAPPAQPRGDGGPVPPEQPLLTGCSRTDT